MLQETIAQPLACVRAFDDSWYVGDDQSAGLRKQSDSQMRLQRGKWIVRDLGPRLRDHRQQRALARVGLTEKAHIGDQLEHQLDASTLARFARLPLAWSLVRGGSETGISPPTTAPLGYQQSIAGHEDFAEGVLVCSIDYHGSWRDR